MQKKYNINGGKNLCKHSVPSFFFDFFLYQVLTIIFVSKGFGNRFSLKKKQSDNKAVPSRFRTAKSYLSQLSDSLPLHPPVKEMEWTDCIMDKILKKVEMGKFWSRNVVK